MYNALTALLLLFTSGLLSQASPAADPEPVVAKLTADTTAVVPGQSFRLGVELKLQPGWHVYYKVPGDIGRGTTVELLAPQDLTAAESRWVKPYRFEDSGMVTYGYVDGTVVVIPVTVPASYKPGEKLQIKVLVTWLACNNSCIPGEAELTLELPVVAVAAVNVTRPDMDAASFNGALDTAVLPPDHQSDSGTPSGNILNKDFVAPSELTFTTFISALFAAFIGGILLNLMPCVLPVLSLKVFGFVKQAGDDRSRIWKMGLAYSAGTISTFLLLALIIIGVQMAGVSIGWGFQFQHPLFVIAMISLITVMSLSLFGVFYVQVGGGSAVDRLAQKEGYVGAFGKGVSATILSTPCTAPFLGSALGFAFSQPWFVVIAIFITIGAGLSAPYMLLCWKPGWMKFLPKPGDWMERFKEAMGFLMLGSAAWLLFVLSRQTGAAAVSATVTFLLILSACAWMIGRFADLNATRSRRLAVWFVSLVLTGLSFWYIVMPTLDARDQATHRTASQVNGVQWEPFSPEALQKHLDDGKIVMIDFTADWCLTCKLNEQVITGQTVTDRMKANNAVVLVVDWTNRDAEVLKLIRRFGRSGVPLCVVFGPKDPGNPIVLPELLTPQMVLDALDKMKK